MAGSFGFQKEKYDVSIACGERVLLPAVRQAGASTLIVSDGFSCQEQIRQCTDREALHTAQVLQMALHQEDSPSPLVYPESAMSFARKRAVANSMANASIPAAATLGAAGVGFLQIYDWPQQVLSHPLAGIQIMTNLYVCHLAELSET